MPWKTAEDNIALGLKALHLPKQTRRQQARNMAQLLGLSLKDLNRIKSPSC